MLQWGFGAAVQTRRCPTLSSNKSEYRLCFSVSAAINQNTRLCLPLTLFCSPGSESSSPEMSSEERLDELGQREAALSSGTGNPRREGVGASPICCSSFVSSSLLAFGLFAFLDNMQKQLFAHQKAEQFYRICGKFQMLPNEKLSTCNVPAGIHFPFPFFLFSWSCTRATPLEPAELA